MNTETTTSNTPANFVGWHRRDRKVRWQRHTEASTEPECSRLLQALPLGGGDFVVLPNGRDPNADAGLRRSMTAVGPKTVHLAELFSARGVSPLCARPPRALNVRKSSWTVCEEAVTCKACLAAMTRMRLANT